MYLFIFAVSLSALILFIGSNKRNSSNTQNDYVNKDLEIFYGMLTESANSQLCQLVYAAKTVLKNFAKISKEKQAVSNLYNERVISDKFYKILKTAEEELVIEKAMIEHEAESLKPGAKDAIFVEANRLLASENNSVQKKKLFDEQAFLKRQDSIKLSRK